MRGRSCSRTDGILWNGVQTDITESVADQEKLRQSEATLRAMGDNLPDSVLLPLASATRRESSQFLYISAGLEKLTGVTVEEAMAQGRPRSIRASLAGTPARAACG